MSSRMASCIFCKIIKGAFYVLVAPSRAATRWMLMYGPLGDIPSFKLFESEKTFAFLDINPLSRGHAVRIAVLAADLNRSY